MLIQYAAVFRDRQAAGGAVEKTGAEGFFQPTYPFAEHRAGDTGHFRRFTEGAAIHNQRK